MSIKQIPASNSSSFSHERYPQASSDPLVDSSTKAVASLQIGGNNDVPSKALRDPLGVCTSTRVVTFIPPKNYDVLLRKLFEIPVLIRMTLCYLSFDELAHNLRVSKEWHMIIDNETTWKIVSVIRGFPDQLPPKISYKQLVRDFFPTMLGQEVYRKYIGEVQNVPPIPPHFIDWGYRPDPLPEGRPGLVKDNYQLVYRPAYVILDLDADSPAALDEKGNLIEKASSAPSKGVQKDSSKRALKVGFTSNNIGKIAEKYLKEGTKTGFSQNSWGNIFQQHGEELSSSGWSYQKKAVIGKGLSYPSEQELAAKAGLEVVSLIDRIIFNLLTYIKSGETPSTDVERSSTVTLSDDMVPRQSAVWWDTSGPSARLNLYFLIGFSFRVGSAVEVPAGSSKDIGP